MSKEQEKIITIYKKGYRVINGNVISPFSGKPRSLTEDVSGYYAFSVRINNSCASVRVHKLVAYQKYGLESLKSGIQVRHFDNNKKNNSDDNIILGTPGQNRMDMSTSERKRIGRIAATNRRKYSDKLINKIRQESKDGARNCHLCKKYNIPESSLRRILTNDYKTKK